MSFVDDAPLPLPGMPDNTPAPPAFQMTLIGQPQPVRIPERLWRSWLDDPAVVSRFESKRYRRRQHQCWPWIGGVSSTGHGSFRAASLPGPSRRGTVPAHLFAYQLEYGVISRLGWSNTDDAVLCHQCDFAGCTNPAHMQLGTNRSNRSEYELRRRNIASPLADVRGPAGRTRAIAAAIRTGIEQNVGVDCIEERIAVAEIEERIAVAEIEERIAVAEAAGRPLSLW